MEPTCLLTCRSFRIWQVKWIPRVNQLSLFQKSENPYQQIRSKQQNHNHIKKRSRNHNKQKPTWLLTCICFRTWQITQNAPAPAVRLYISLKRWNLGNESDKKEWAAMRSMWWKPVNIQRSTMNDSWKWRQIVKRGFFFSIF